MQWFTRELQQFAEDVETVFLCDLPMKQLTPAQEDSLLTATHCHICEKPFTKDDVRN